MKNLISAADVKDYTVVNLNVEAHKFDIIIADATRDHLRPLLGPGLLSALLAFVASAPEAPTSTVGSKQQLDKEQADYATALAAWRTANAGKLLDLWDQLKSCLAQWALVVAWPNILVQIENGGIVVKTGKSEGTTVADAATINQVLTGHRNTAIGRGEELVRWLEAHKSDYATYQSTQPLPTGVQPINFFGGIDLN